MEDVGEDGPGASPVDLGRWGVWSLGLRLCDPSVARDAAMELEGLGFDAVWIPGVDDGIWERARLILAATERLVVATAIVSIWTSPPREAAAATARLEAEFPGRFLLCLGVSHAPLVARSGQDYRRPYAMMVEWLDELDASAPTVPVNHRMLGANHPRMLALAGARSLGSHTYLGTPEHTRAARLALGPTAALAPEQCVVLETDPGLARAAARAHVARYMDYPNYVRSWINQGFSERDLAGGGSDHLLDSVVAWGDSEQLVERLAAHHDGGADHVCVQVLGADDSTRDRTQTFPAEWRALAEALRLAGPAT